MTSRDLFGDRADLYTRHRPGYPDALFGHLAGLVRAHEVAWDCGTGSGQSAHGLARHFRLVVGTDSSLRQLEHARRAEGVHFVAAATEQAPLRPGTVDVVAVAAALHWFDPPRFHAEVRRVARPGAVIAAWSYYHARIDPLVDRIMVRYADDVVGKWWPAGMQANRDAYQTLDFPFEPLEWPAFEAEAVMRLEDLLGFMRTWSASQAYARALGKDPIDEVRVELDRAWGDPEAERRVRWPLHGRAGRI